MSLFWALQQKYTQMSKNQIKKTCMDTPPYNASHFVTTHKGEFM